MIALAAAASFLGFAIRGSARATAYWTISAVAFAGALWVASNSQGSGPWLIAFALLFLLPTLVHAAFCVIRKRTAVPVAALAASDLCLVLALSALHSETGSWALPQLGEWRQGASLVTAAALLRFGAGVDGAGEKSAGLTSVGWWQGVLLAAWPARAQGFQVAAALVLAAYWALSVLARTRKGWYRSEQAAGFAIAGVAILCMAALGLPSLSLVGAGLAGMGFALGNRTLSVWVLAALPFSPLALATGQASLWVTFGLFAIVFLWLFWERPIPGTGGALLSLAGAAAAAAGAFDAQIGWVAAGAGLIAFGFWIWVPHSPPGPVDAVPREPQAGSLRWVQLGVCGVLLAAAGLVILRLGIVGMQTGFL